MKLFIISDIHGSLYYLKKVMEIFGKENYDKLVILGDELYHGPRNPLPKDYSPKEVIEILNKYKDKIIAVRGNCDSEVDQMVLSYPIMSDYSMIYLGNKRVFLTHGHIYIATPPLYKVVPKKGEGEYLYDDKALEKYRKHHTGFTLQRYKGLGEMDPKQLWETTLNPETRILKQVEIEDAKMASDVTSMLMGSEVAPRRNFIYTHATDAELDI